MKTGIVYNPFLPEMIDDPYPVYRLLRDEDPVHYSDVVRSWVLTRYRDVVEIIADPRFSSDRTKARKYKGRPPTSPGTFMTDPPQHTRVRNLVNKAFTPRLVSSMQSRVESVVSNLLDDLTTDGEVDLIEQFAYVLPMTVISEIIGGPASDHPRFQAWGRAFAGAQDHTFSGRSGTTAGGEMATYFAELVPRRHADPREDLVTALLEASDGEDRLSDAEVIEVLVGMLFAGHETTVNLIGNGVLSLLRYPEQFARVRDEDVDRKCVEEFLRYESPAQIIARTVGADLEWDSYELRRGDAVVLLIGGANRDPAAFENPETLDVSRSPNAHVGFGHGPHFCLGAQLSRLEARVAIPALVRRFPRMRLVNDDADWRPTVVLRGLTSLRLRLG